MGTDCLSQHGYGRFELESWAKMGTDFLSQNGYGMCEQCVFAACFVAFSCSLDVWSRFRVRCVRWVNSGAAVLTVKAKHVKKNNKDWFKPDFGGGASDCDMLAVTDLEQLDSFEYLWRAPLHYDSINIKDMAGIWAERTGPIQTARLLVFRFFELCFILFSAVFDNACFMMFSAVFETRVLCCFPLCSRTRVPRCVRDRVFCCSPLCSRPAVFGQCSP